jgi:glycosyltransferase involved in cell wall biosynthesis
MRIAQIAPLFESVPPHGYGGTERVVSYLTERLVELGHEVTLFASADSETRAALVPCAPQALRLAGYRGDPAIPHIVMLEEVYRRVDQFDVIHDHVDVLGRPFARRADIPVLATLHGRLDLEEIGTLFAEYPEQWMVSISDSQREPWPDASWIATTPSSGAPRPRNGSTAPSKSPCVLAAR